LAKEGQRLRDAMKQAMDDRGMSVSELARVSGVSRPLIYQWWRGEQRPSRTSIARVAKPLGVEPSDLLGLYERRATPAQPDDLTSAIRETNALLREVLSRLAQADEASAAVRGRTVAATIRSRSRRSGASG
jgi:transcriptional regulator with XRE-family HTH domain